MLMGLRLAFDIGLRNVILDSDSMAAVSLVLGTNQLSPPLSQLIGAVKQMMLIFSGVQEVHVLWEGNRIAECFDSMGFDLSFGVHIFSVTLK